MPNSSPPWVTPAQFVVIDSGGQPVVPSPANEAPAGGAGEYVGADDSYQVIVSWTVTAGRTGLLIDIEMVSTIPNSTNWKVEIGDTVFMVDLLQQSSLSLPFANLQLAAGTVVKVSVLSTDGSTITADACIVAKETF
jgi:hypothetical protein